MKEEKGAIEIVERKKMEQQPNRNEAKDMQGCMHECTA
jgi:hypothetical protein